MKEFSLHELAKRLNTPYHSSDLKFSYVSIDSRQINPNDVFIALKGETFDGHDFIPEAIHKGAAAIIASETSSISIPHLRVTNTKDALAVLAKIRRIEFQKPIIGLTGSNGKTTTKAILANILKQKHCVLAPVSSMNNDIGVPLTLIQLNSQHQFAVIEMGTNHFGEIANLTQIAEPDVSIITNIGPAHLEFFGNLEGVAKAKAEIFQGLKESGHAVLNADDPYTPQLIHYLDGKRHFTFGVTTDADVSAADIEIFNEGNIRFKLHINSTAVPVTLPMLGKHNVYNALAAAAAAHVCGISLAEIRQGLETVAPAPKRLVRKIGLQHSKVIDDSYSAIPNAVIAALDVLRQSKGKKVFVFGGMAELKPDDAVSQHQQIGDYAKSIGIDYFLGVGKLTEHSVTAFGKGGHYFKNKSDLTTELKQLLNPDITVLIKGSRGMRMEEVVEAITKGNN